MTGSDYESDGIRKLGNIDGDYYICPAFLDKLTVHVVKNFLDLPKIKVPLILGIWGGKGQGKSFQCELAFKKMGINPIMMSAGELESGNAGEPAKLVRQRYREASDIIAKGKMSSLYINDLDAGAGRMGGTTQYTVNNQMVNATLMNIADNPTNVQLPGVYQNDEIPRVPVVVTGNDFSTLYAPLVRVYDDKVRDFIASEGLENLGKRLVNPAQGQAVTFERPMMSLDVLLEYGRLLTKEQDNVTRVQLANEYLDTAALPGSDTPAVGERVRDTPGQGQFTDQSESYW